MKIKSQKVFSKKIRAIDQSLTINEIYGDYLLITQIVDSKAVKYLFTLKKSTYLSIV